MADNMAVGLTFTALHCTAASDRGTTPACGTHPSFRPRKPICQFRLSFCSGGAWHTLEHECEKRVPGQRRPREFF